VNWRIAVFTIRGFKATSAVPRRLPYVENRDEQSNRLRRPLPGQDVVGGFYALSVNWYRFAWFAAQLTLKVTPTSKANGTLLLKLIPD
jgi:hypothetical protein